MILVKGIGNIPIIFTKTNRKIILKNVLFVPELEVNLLSLYNIINKGYLISFKSNNIIIRNRNNDIIAEGYYYNKLATFNTISTLNYNIEVINNTSYKLDIVTFHKRLGHINKDYLYKLASNLNINLDTNNSNLLDNCITCLKAKFTKKVNKSPITTKVDNFGDLIYIDIGGPISPITNRGYKYYITFLDYKSKYLEIDLLKSRKDTLVPIKNYINRVKIQDNTSIKLLQADNEFNTNSINEFTKELGIIFRFSSPYNPELKGGGERINRTLFNKVRALLIQANLPNKYWAEALISSVYLYNRTPNSSINFITPYKSKYNIKPNINNIRIWGSLVYKLEPKELLKNSKLDSRVTPYYLIGYISNNLYKLLNPKTSKVIIARDIKILEDNYYKDNYNNQDLIEDTIAESIENPNNIENTSNKINTSNNRINNKDLIRRNPKVIINRKLEPIPIINSSIIEEINPLTSNNNKENYNNLLLETLLYTSKEGDPLNYKEVLLDKDKDNWLKAMQIEYNQLIKNNTWKLVPKPLNYPIIKGRWVLNKKYNLEDNIPIYKAR